MTTRISIDPCRLLAHFFGPMLLLAVPLLILPGGCNYRPPGDGDQDPPATDPLADRVGGGTVRVTGTVRSADLDEPLPLGGVRLAAGDAVSHSNVDGSFVLLGVGAGSQQLLVDGSELLAGDGHYGEVVIALNLVEQEDRNFERPIYLPFVPHASERTVTPEKVTTVSSADGVVLKIPPGGARVDGEEYDGVISIQTVRAERTPIALPPRLEGRTGMIVSIQPAGIEFPVPLAITIPEVERDVDAQLDGGADGMAEMISAPPAVAFRSLYSRDILSGDFVNTGIGEPAGSVVETTVGGVRGSGIHFFTDFELALVEPCQGQDTGAARACLSAGVDLVRSIGKMNSVSLPGARTVLGRLDAALLARGSSLSRAQAVREISLDLYPLARTGVIEYQSLYQRLGELDDLVFALAAARAACQGKGLCVDKADARSDAENEVEAGLDEAVANVDAYASRFDRLSAATVALEPFYAGEDSITEDALEEFHRVAEEFNDAYRDFEPFSSPVDAYDVLADSLGEMERAAGVLLKSVSASPGDQGGGAPATLMRICENLGAVQIGVADGGYAGLQPGSTAGLLDEDCIIVAQNRERELTSIPASEPELLGALQPPAQIALAGTPSILAAQLDQFQSGILTADSPVHVWELDTAEREGALVSFEAEGDVMVGLAVQDGVVQIGRSGGFAVANLSAVQASPSGRVSFAVYVYATDIASGEKRSYALTVVPDPTLFDFGEPVAGSFDIETRAAAVLFEAGVGQGVFVEKRCCGSHEPGEVDGDAYFFTLLGPGGAAVPRLSFLDGPAGSGNELFELQESGLHRLILTPLEGRFTDYQIVIHLVPQSEALPYEPGTEATVFIDQVGETVRYAFVSTGEQTVTIEGLTPGETTPSADGLGLVVFSVYGPEGEIIVEKELLYSDGSSFATRTLALPSAGTYELVFSTMLDADPLTGSFTFRIGLQSEPEAAPDPNRGRREAGR